jgi:hypothetical protein
MATNTSKDTDEWVKEFMAKQQELADAAGMSLLEYLAQAEGGILRPVILKILKHAIAHPQSCPPDCQFETSLERLKEKPSVA